jgi:hypothetical protein
MTFTATIAPGTVSAKPRAKPMSCNDGVISAFRRSAA